MEGLLLQARCSPYSLSAGRHHGEAAGPRAGSTCSIAQGMPLQLEKHMLSTVEAFNYCRQRTKAHAHFVSLLWWDQPQRCGFVRLAHRSLWLQRGRCDQAVAQRDRLFARGAIQTMFWTRGAIETMFWRHCGWWNNSALSGTGISNLVRPSSHLLVRWEPWNRRIFRFQNEVHRHKSNRTV